MLPYTARWHNSGFTMIEVLVALFVLAFGLLGLALLQTTGLRMNTNSYSRTQATYAAYDIIDRMRANPSTLVSYDMDTTIKAEGAISTYNICLANNTCNCAVTDCSPSALAAYDLGQWYAQQNRLIPGAKDAASLSVEPQRSTIDVQGNVVIITMYWIEPETEEAAANKPRQQSWQVEIYP